MDAPFVKPKRRARYSGKNPRHFSEKYKELNPDRYPEELEKVRSAGKTPAGTHRPIMIREILEVLQPCPGEVAVDGTLGYGGHAEALLQSILPGGKLIGLDVDSVELRRTEQRLRDIGLSSEVFSAHVMNFAGILKVLPEAVDMILLDLGLSSMQIDNPERGFTFREEGPLDMRMNPQRGIPASAWIGRTPPSTLAKLLVENADEPQAERIAQSVSAAAPQTTWQLAEAVRSVDVNLDTVRRVFQAVRIAVNDEFGALQSFLHSMPLCLKPGGRVAILTFHSGEDRRVKKMFQELEREADPGSIQSGLIRPTADEVRSNPRSLSAKLRWLRFVPL